MCLIVAKPRGKPMPSNKKMKRWFKSYPHGVGIAFQYQGKVRLIKGAMDIKQMFRLIEKMKQVLYPVNPQDIDIVIQFRQAVTGSICPAFCHPFPITAKQEELDSLDVLTTCALAHNGVIFEYSPFTYYEGNYYTSYTTNKKEDINDAQEFIKDYLVPMGDSLWNPAVQKLIGVHTNSKFALLSNKGITYIGEFIEDDGYWYSNGGYLPTKPAPMDETAILTSYNWVESSDDLPSGGICCDACGEYRNLVYRSPEADGSLLCGACFPQFYGRQPNEDERAF